MFIILFFILFNIFDIKTERPSKKQNKGENSFAVWQLTRGMGDGSFRGDTVGPSEEERDKLALADLT